jgi:hypothetical protein
MYSSRDSTSPNFHAARPVSAGAAAVSDDAPAFVVVFHRDETRLCNTECEALRSWVQTWLQLDRPTVVIVGCCPDTARSARQDRLEQLAGQLAVCGVPRDWIRCTSEWAEPSWPPPSSALPPDVAWLQVATATRKEPDA